MRREAAEAVIAPLRPQWEPVVLNAGVDPETAAFVIVPGVSGDLVDVLEARRDSLRQNLENLLVTPTGDNAAIEPRRADFLAAPRQHEAACAACRGQCCGGGENHAYLRRSDLERFATSNNLADEADGIAHYVERVPKKSVEGSCIFHGEQGCALSRSMRNDICNSMRCGALVELDAAVAEGVEAVVAVAVTLDQTALRRVGVSSATHLEVADFETPGAYDA